MNPVRRWLGPKSTYDPTIPCLYEARQPVAELPELFHSYQADTVCALVERLDQEGVSPAEVTLWEVYQEREAVIPSHLYATPDHRWLTQQELCLAFEAEYPGHIARGTCSFHDREKVGIGPF